MDGWMDGSCRCRTCGSRIHKVKRCPLTMKYVKHLLTAAAISLTRRGLCDEPGNGGVLLKHEKYGVYMLNRQSSNACKGGSSPRL
jgi:hypothetical protein